MNETAVRRISFLAVNRNAFSTDRRFFEIYCEQMEANLKNMAHGFSSEQNHLVLLRQISPESEGF